MDNYDMDKQMVARSASVGGDTPCSLNRTIISELSLVVSQTCNAPDARSVEPKCPTRKDV
eukprot:scaffold389227_cov17-Prasinocladus_malaysianus.AAC.1